MSSFFVTFLLGYATCIVSYKNPANLPICTSTEGADPIKTFVVGGIPADRYEFPWLVNLIVKRSAGKKICGGSLIDWNLVLTAAHCITEETDDGFKTLENQNVKVTAGDFQIDCDDGTEQISNPETMIVHPNYKNIENSLLNDIALVKLKKGFQHSLAVRRIPLSSFNIIDENFMTGTVAGWGSTLPDSEINSNVLMKVSVPVIKSGNCKNDKETQFCAGGAGKDSCRGDSGGPFMCGDEEYFVCGVVSSGPIFCGEKPGIYTNVFPYLEWIAQHRTGDLHHEPSNLPLWLYFIFAFASISVLGAIVYIFYLIFKQNRGTLRMHVSFHNLCNI